MSRTLLADLAVMMSSPEDVATRALELVLGRSPAANASVERLLDLWRGHSGPSIFRWVSQVTGDDQARTDLQGFDEHEDTVAILENKFWAGLTDNQPTTYLDRLPPGGMLVFVVPAKRVALIAYELALRLAAPGRPTATFAREGGSQVAHLKCGRTLVVAPWSAILNALAAALEAAEEHDNRADVHQLEGLVERQEQEGFQPFTATDLTGETPRLIVRLCDLVDAAVQELLTRGYADKKNLRATGSHSWYGHYLRIHGYGCLLAMHAGRWAAAGISPIWLRVSSSDWKFTEEIRLPLRRAVNDPATIQEDRGYWEGFWIPIRLAEGRDRDAVLRDVLAQVDRVAQALATTPAPPSGSEPATGDAPSAIV